MPQNLRSVSTAFQKAVAAGGAAVYRTTPAPGGDTTTRPADGSVAANDVWQEVWENGASDPTYLLVAKTGQTVAPRSAVAVSA